MPHSLYLGSGIVQARLREYDTANGHLRPSTTSSRSANDDKTTYIPSLPAIKHCLKYSITELSVCLFTFALFVNSAILIVAGASLYGNPNALSASIFGIHALLAESISPAAGTIFALALLLSGVSAGIICTIAGQMVSEGSLNWAMRPWMRRLITRAISIMPSIIIAGAVGRTGLDAALNASQVALSTVLPFVSAPLIYFTCVNKFMTVSCRDSHDGDANTESRTRDGSRPYSDTGGVVRMANSWLVTILAVLLWLVIAAMNVANLVLLGKGG